MINEEITPSKFPPSPYILSQRTVFSFFEPAIVPPQHIRRRGGIPGSKKEKGAKEESHELFAPNTSEMELLLDNGTNYVFY